MKILFIGGTGRLSKDVARYAADSGNDVFLLTRGSKNRSQYVRSNYTMIYANIRDHQECNKALHDLKFDVIIDFLTFNTDDLVSTLKIIQGKYTQYIFISTATVYKKNSEDEIITESGTAVGNDLWAYAWNKYCCEEYLRSNKQLMSGTYTIVRPYVTYGDTRVPYPIVPFDTTKEWTFINRIDCGKPIPVFDHGNTKTTLTHTSDFAKGVAGLFLNPYATNIAVHVVGENRTTWGSVLDILERAIGKPINRMDFSQQEICKIIPAYREILQGDKGTNMLFDSSLIKKMSPEFQNETSLKDGIYDMVNNMRANSTLHNIDWYWNGQIDRLCRSFGFASYKKKSLKDKLLYLQGYDKNIDHIIGTFKKIIKAFR